MLVNAKDAVVASFATFSRIRVPARLLDAVDWRDGVALAGFPLVGVVEGLAMLAWALASSWLCLPTPIAAAVFTCLPVLVTGGIHLDGLCDVADAVCSHADRDRKLQILKDPRAGAFGVMALACYLLLFYSLAAGADPMQLVRMSISLPAALAFSRCLSGLAVLRWPKARPDGMARAMAGEDDNPPRPAVRALAGQAVLSGVSLVALAPAASGPFAIAAAAAVLAWYHRFALREFGGVTGDTAGWFLQWCELAMLAVLILGGMR